MEIDQVTGSGVIKDISEIQLILTGLDFASSSCPTPDAGVATKVAEKSVDILDASFTSI